MATLHIERLGKRYGNSGDWALRDFSLTVGDGELVAIVGPSGCGKSTLLRMVAGLEPESAGTIALGTRVLNDLAPKDRDLALMFQSYTLLPHLTVEENLAFGLKLRGVPKAERLTRARGAAETLGLMRLLARLPSEISGGERQRAALGRAILREPAAFLFDEPLSSLDAQMRLQLRVEIQRLHQRVRVPMLFVTHDQSEALTLGDRVLVLNRGAIQQIAPPEELYLRPANAFVASFIGAPGMNLFAGRLVKDAATSGAARFESSLFTLDLPPALAAAVAELGDGEPLTLGVRPEHLKRTEPHTVGPAVTGTVTAVERHAGQATVYLERREEAGAVSFAARTPEAFAIRPGDATSWTFEAHDVHLFAGPNGARLATGT
jgi:multiple sugar transport system ATP-binding protein